MLDSADCATLLAYARTCVKAATERGTVRSLNNPSEKLSSVRATFVTIRSKGELRGCIGQIHPKDPLWKSVQDMAQAACQDHRFPPLTSSDPFEIEISILSLPTPIREEEIVVGKHGLIVEANGKRGVLLPHVATENGWDRETFIREVLQKAGLPFENRHSHDLSLKSFMTDLIAEK